MKADEIREYATWANCIAWLMKRRMAKLAKHDSFLVCDYATARNCNMQCWVCPDLHLSSVMDINDLQEYDRTHPTNEPRGVCNCL